MAKTNAYTEFLRDLDVEARRAELRAFIGPHPEPFIKMYEALRAQALAGRPKFGATTSFVVMAFFLGPCWFFYRKMWIWAWSLVAAIIVLAFLPVTNRIGLFLGVALAFSGRFAYLQHAIGRIVKLRGPAPQADLTLLTREGGVSARAGWISSAGYLLLTVLVVAALFLYLGSGGNLDALR